MNWDKLGLIFCAAKENKQMVSGARAPVVLHIENDLFRIYFASYDQDGRGRIFSLLIDIKKPRQILSIETKPIIDYGEVGYFDDNGIIPSWIIKTNKKLLLYTFGFSLKNKVIFDAASGVAISENAGKSFTKIKGPILDRGIDDPCFAASPCVLFDDGMYKMWFVSCDKWELLSNGEYRHYYNIKYK